MRRSVMALLIVIFCAGCAETDKQKDVLSRELEVRQSTQAVFISSAEVINEMEEIIAKSYYKQDVNARAFAEELFSGGTSSDDPHTNYLSPIERKEFENSVRGVICGIGAQLEIKKKFLSIKKVVKNSPAERAGIKSDDFIIAVASDGERDHSVLLKSQTPEEVVQLIRGEKGTLVYLRILRQGKALDFFIIRKEVKQELVFGRFVKPGIGYIYLAEFGGDDTLNDFSILVSSLQEHGMRTLILDLRYNPGGYLNYATILSKWFQNPRYGGPVVVLKSRGRTVSDLRSKYLDALSRFGQGKYSNIPLVVLVNKYSASASEIAAAFLKNYCDVPVIGTRTYGKGTVQRTFPLQNGGGLHLTIAEYFVGEKEVPVNRIGVSPTIEVENPKKVGNEKEDAQLQRAIQEAEKLIK